MPKPVRQPADRTMRTTGGRYGSGESKGDNKSLDLYGVDEVLLRDAVASCILEGDAILFSLTSDQGACCVRILQGDVQDVWYPATTEALSVVLQRVRDLSKT